MEFRLGELFCGPGGLGLGAKMARITSASGEEYSIKHMWANDIDEAACKTYAKNIMPDCPQNVLNVPVEDLDMHELGAITGLAFGFPCNDFSIVGEQKGMGGKYGSLYSYGVKALQIHNPLWFVAENVGGLQSANDGFALSIILNDLMNAGRYGYKLTPHYYKFEEYGVPQARHRIVIVGIRGDVDLEFRVPKPSHTNRYVTAKQAIEEPPIPKNAPNHEFTRHHPRVVKMLSYIPPGGNAWSETIPVKLRLNVKGAKLSQIYKRLEADKPAYTVTGSGGGGTHVYHWCENRALTNRERARLQTFPDNFIFCGSKEQVRKQIGMAVPPLAAKIIFEALLKTFAGVEYDWVPAVWNTGQDEVKISLEEIAASLSNC